MSHKDFLLNEALEVKRHVFHFLRHPLKEIKNIPHWGWPRVIALQISMAAITGALTGLVERKATFSIIAGLFLAPILTFIPIGISALFFYYCFQLFERKTVSFRHLFNVILFASIPLYIFKIVSSYAAVITMIALAFSSLLVVKGIIHNFQIERKRAIKMVLSLYILFFVMWTWDQSSTLSRFQKNWGSGDSMEAPEVELGQ